MRPEPTPSFNYAVTAEPYTSRISVSIVGTEVLDLSALS
jgi:hypothetical protein